MNDKKLEQILDELSAIKRLLILLLQQQEVKGENIGKALGVSAGRVSQMASTKKYRKRKKMENG
jgi:DNA-directed RNA polymerase specialized sigma subunit